MSKKRQQLPELPNNVDAVRPIKDIHGRERSVKIEAEVKLACRRDDAAFALYLQKLRVLKDAWGDDTLYRLGYYSLRVKGDNKGTWGWGQYAPMGRPEEFAELFRLAREAGWEI